MKKSQAWNAISPILVWFFFLSDVPFLSFAVQCFTSFFFVFLFNLNFRFVLSRDKFQNQISEQQRQTQSAVSNTNQNRRNIEVKKKVWSVDPPEPQPQPQQQSPTIHPTNGNGHHSSVQQQTNGMDVSRTPFNRIEFIDIFGFSSTDKHS